MRSNGHDDRLDAIVASYRVRRNDVDPSKLALAIKKLSSPPSRAMMVLFNTLAYYTPKRGMEAPVGSVSGLVRKLNRRTDFIGSKTIAHTLENFPHRFSMRMLDLFENLSKDSLSVRLMNGFFPWTTPAPVSQEGMSSVNAARFRAALATQHGRPSPYHGASTRFDNSRRAAADAHISNVDELGAMTVSILISRSVVMEYMWETIRKNADAYIRDMRLTRRKVRLSIVLFDKESHDVYRWEPIFTVGGVPPHTSFGRRAKLFDAMAEEILEVRNFRAKNAHYEQSLLAVYTDGVDSGSDLGARSIKKMVDEVGDSWLLCFPCDLEASNRLARFMGK